MSIKTFLSLGLLTFLTNAGVITSTPSRTQPNAPVSVSTNLVGGLLGGVGNVLGSTVNGVTNTLGNTVKDVGSTVGNTVNEVGNTINGIGSSLGAALNGVGNVAGGVVATVGLSSSATVPPPFYCSDAKVQPIYDQYQKNSKGNNERYTCSWQHPYENHAVSEAIDSKSDVHLKHRWTGKNGKSHYTQHWIDHNTGVAYHHTIREAVDGCIHQILVAIDLDGTFETSHIKRDAYGQKTIISDCPSKNAGLLLNLELNI